ncbi:MAG: ABC transporter ATP-binding protein [Acholeplasmataceae bacterium]|nr:MAG: ABC transporter ATP-binding protein [Acholeplasmataceae bacterium]
MNTPIIEINQLTKSYGINKGVFNLSFSVNEGEVFGFIGPNGAGKTTTIRHLLGFIGSDHGDCHIFGLETKAHAAEIQESLGYLPGEIMFFDHMTGVEFLKLMANLRKLTDLSKMHELIAFFELDPAGRIKKMSKGMKQKLGLIAAFMHDPKVLILDEPTSGLDPLMQTKFVELVLEEKKQGKTILMSSHSFEEVERTCDRAGIIKEGVLIALEDIQELKKTQRKAFIVRTKDDASIETLKTMDLEIIQERNRELEVAVSGDIMPFIKKLANIQVESLDIKSQSLEEVFMDYYKRGERA